MNSIRVYGTTWCSDCRQAKLFLDKQMIDYDWIDIEHDSDGESLVMKINNGKRIVPTIMFPDESYLIEPSNKEISEKLKSCNIAFQGND